MSRRTKSNDKSIALPDGNLPGECTIPPPVPESLVNQVVLKRSEYQADEIREYIYGQTQGELVTHLEKLKTEHVFDRQIEGWDVRTNKDRYWVVTNPTNLYSQTLFPSLDYTITFHVGLSVRIAAIEAGKARIEQRDRLSIAWRKWEQAADALGLASEAEDFQVVGLRCRESLIAMVRGVAEDSMVPAGQEKPKAADFVHWSELIAGTIAGGSSAEQVRSYIKAVAKPAWQLVNWLTHASNAVRFDARIALQATENVLGAFSAALVRFEKGLPDRCPNCSSYRIDSVYRPDLEAGHEYFSLCESCGWTDLPPTRTKTRRNRKKKVVETN